MLTIKVWCLPALSQDKLQDMFWEVVDGVGSVESMVKAGHTGPGNMLILFPSDLMKFGLGTEVLIEVTGLTDVSLRNIRDLDELAEKLAKIVHRFVHKGQINCCVHMADPFTWRWQSGRGKALIERRSKCRS